MSLRSWSDAEKLINELAWMATWREVLEWKINSPHRYFEAAHLEAELKSWKRTSATIAKEYKKRSA